LFAFYIALVVYIICCSFVPLFILMLICVYIVILHVGFLDEFHTFT